MVAILEEVGFQVHARLAHQRFDLALVSGGDSKVGLAGDEEDGAVFPSGAEGFEGDDAGTVKKAHR